MFKLKMHYLLFTLMYFLLLTSSKFLDPNNVELSLLVSWFAVSGEHSNTKIPIN